jgi:hypothetical protein
MPQLQSGDWRLPLLLGSAASTETVMQHFLLIKRDGLARSGARLDASQSALALLNARVWPLWRRTPNRARVKAGDMVAVYLAGAGESRVIARARVERVGPWNRELANAYPLMLDGEPSAVLHLVDIDVFKQSEDVRALLPRLSFVRPGLRKWGVHFTGGMRSLPAADFALMTGVGTLGASPSRSAEQSLTYVVPAPPPRPFRRGDKVETLDRDGSVAWPFPSIRLCRS